MNKIDKENMLEAIKSLKNQINKGLELGTGVKLKNKPQEIIIAGMGGSALPGEVLKSVFIDSDLKITISKDYQIPKWANQNTLVFAISYSGNTEETVSAFENAIKNNCEIVVIASGGKLEELAKENDTKLIKVPTGLQPRAAIGYLFFILLKVLQENNLVPDLTKEIAETKTALDLEKHQVKAKEIAEKLIDKIPIIYTSENLAAVGYKWKISFNENAKAHAFCNVYPEMNHNEINAYVNIKGDFHVLILTNNTDHPQNQKRMQITKALYEKQGVPVTEIPIQGNSLLEKIFAGIMLGDLVAYFLAIKYKTDPTPVKMVEDLKNQL